MTNFPILNIHLEIPVAAPLLTQVLAPRKRGSPLLPAEKRNHHSRARSWFLKIRKLFFFLSRKPHPRAATSLFASEGVGGVSEPVQPGAKGTWQPSGGLLRRRLTQDVPDESHHEHDDVPGDQDPLIIFRVEVFPPQVLQEFLVFIVVGGVQRGLLSFIQLRSKWQVATRGWVLQIGAGHHGLESGWDQCCKLLFPFPMSTGESRWERLRGQARRGSRAENDVKSYRANASGVLCWATSAAHSLSLQTIFHPGTRPGGCSNDTERRRRYLGLCWSSITPHSSTESAATASSRADRELKWERKKKKVMKIILSCFSVGSISLFFTFSFSISHVQFV